MRRQPRAKHRSQSAIHLRSPRTVTRRRGSFTSQRRRRRNDRARDVHHDGYHHPRHRHRGRGREQTFDSSAHYRHGGGGGFLGGFGGDVGLYHQNVQPMALSPVASRSMLTCNREFQRCYPHVYQGLCKGLIDVNKLIAQEVVIPVREEVALHKSSIRSRWAVTAAISEHLWKAVHGKFPDPKVAPRLVRKVAEYFFDKIESGVLEAEDERSLLQWLLRFDVENGIDVRVTTSMVVGLNSVIATIEGAAHIRRKKGTLLGLVSKDIIVVDLEVVIKALFLNGGQLLEINNDPLFSDCILAGENRFAAQFLLPS